jgi:tetratricopeptide (TPR) repeat protein
MRFAPRVPALAGLSAVLLFSATGCNQLLANDQLNKGVAEFKNAHYEQAEGHFQKAIELAPNDPKPRLYLATTYSSQVVPNSTTPENLKNAQMALAGFNDVLSRDPNDIQALKQIAAINLNTGKLDIAKDYQEKVIKLDPNDSEAYYTIGIVDWKQAYQNSVTVLGAEGLTDKSDGNLKLSKAGCAKMTTENQALVTQGLQYLQKAIDINPTYEEAMTIMSLMERRKADLECGNIPAVKADLAAAEMWAQKSMGARKANEAAKEAKLKGGVTQ